MQCMPVPIRKGAQFLLSLVMQSRVKKQLISRAWVTVDCIRSELREKGVASLLHNSSHSVGFTGQFVNYAILLVENSPE